MIRRQALALAMCASLLICCSAQTSVKDAPDAWTAVLDMLTAYAWQQTACETPGGPIVPTIDTDGSSDWYSLHFPDKLPLKDGYTFQLTPPVPDNSTAIVTPGRTSTLLCPWKAFPYYCALQGGEVQTTGSSSTTSKQLSASIGVSIKSSFGVTFFGNGASVVESLSATYAVTGKDDTVQTTSDTRTDTAGLSLTTDPSTGNCTVIVARLDSLTASATMQLQAVFQGYVGFKTSEKVYWGSDNTYTDIRVQDIATIVNNAKVNTGCKEYPSSLPQAAGFEAFYNATTGKSYVVFSNTFRIDYFQGSNATVDQYTYLNTSAACLSGNPVNLSTTMTQAQGSGRHLHAHNQHSTDGPQKPFLKTSILSGVEKKYRLSSTGALTPVSEHEAAQQHTSDRMLLQTPQLGKLHKQTCPKVAYVTYKGPGPNKRAVVEEVIDPNCYGAGRRKYQAIKVAARKARAAFSKHCVLHHLALQPNGTGSNLNLSVEVPGTVQTVPGTLYKVAQTGRQCRFKPTKPVHKPLPQDAGPETLDVKINRLFNALCYHEAGTACDGVDYDRSHGYLTQDQKTGPNATFYWADGSIPPVTVDLGMTTPGAAEYEVSSRQYTAACRAAANHPNSTLCERSVTDLNSQGSSDTTTTTQSVTIGASIGVQVKYTSEIGADGSDEVSLTSSLGYSWSTGESTSYTNGQSSQAILRAPIPQNGCVKLLINQTTIKSGSTVQAYACLTGNVQVLQKSPCQITYPISYICSKCKDNRCPWWPYPQMQNVVFGCCKCQGSGTCWPDLGDDYTYKCYPPTTDCDDYNYDDYTNVPSAVHVLSMPLAVTIAQDANLQNGGIDEWYIDNQGRACLSQPISLSLEQGVAMTVDPIQYPEGSAECNDIPEATAPLTAVETPEGLTGSGWVVQKAELITNGGR